MSGYLPEIRQRIESTDALNALSAHAQSMPIIRLLTDAA